MVRIEPRSPRRKGRVTVAAAFLLQSTVASCSMGRMTPGFPPGLHSKHPRNMQNGSHGTSKRLAVANSSANGRHFTCLECDHLNFNSPVAIITLHFNRKLQILLVQNSIDCFLMPFVWGFNFWLPNEFNILPKNVYLMCLQHAT